MQLWADYNEFAMWCLMAMTASGIALWLMAYAHDTFARVSLAAGIALFAILFFWTR